MIKNNDQDFIEYIKEKYRDDYQQFQVDSKTLIELIKIRDHAVLIRNLLTQPSFDVYPDYVSSIVDLVDQVKVNTEELHKAIRARKPT